MEEDFRFLLMKSPENGLIFVALDSVVGYIRHLSRELSNVSESSEDEGAAVAGGISRAFDLLANRIEEIDSAKPNATEI